MFSLSLFLRSARQHMAPYQWESLLVWSLVLIKFLLALILKNPLAASPQESIPHTRSLRPLSHFVLRKKTVTVELFRRKERSYGHREMMCDLSNDFAIRHSSVEKFWIMGRHRFPEWQSPKESPAARYALRNHRKIRKHFPFERSVFNGHLRVQQEKKITEYSRLSC